MKVEFFCDGLGTLITVVPSGRGRRAAAPGLWTGHA